MVEECIFKKNCADFAKDNCNIACINYIEMDYLVKSSNIPKKHQRNTELYPEKIDVGTFTNLKRIKEDIVNFTDKGNFLYIWGNSTGSGKTTWAIKIMLTYFAFKHLGNNFEDLGYFIYLPNLLSINKDFSEDSNKDDIMLAVKTRKLVIIDDIAINKAGNYDSNTLAEIIDYRYSNELATIFTSNVSPDELNKILEPRLADRVLSGYVYEIKGGSRRNAYGGDYIGSSPSTSIK